MKDPKILEEANRKIRFIPLTPLENEMHQTVVNNKDQIALSTYENSLKLLSDGGR